MRKTLHGRSPIAGNCRTASPVCSVDREKLDRLYRSFNQRRFVHPDPLEFLYGYPDIRDREIVGLVAAALAYGRVTQIRKSVASALHPMGPSPRLFLENVSCSALNQSYDGFVHRFANGKNMASLLWCIRSVIRKYGSLGACYGAGRRDSGNDRLRTLSLFADRLMAADPNGPGHLVPRPERGSACKRLNLFLRWMVRKDAVDPGGWQQIPPADLIVPLDVHMHRIGLRFGFTHRRQANMHAAMEVTEGFRKLSPEDPVRYDFALTRLGIRNDIPVPGWLQCGDSDLSL